MTEEFAPRRRFDESRVRRNRGRFAKKVGKALLIGGIPTSRLQQTPQAQIFARHADGDVTHVSQDGRTRLVYNAADGRFDRQEARSDGSWESTGSLGKIEAFLETVTGWRVSNDQDQGAGVRAIPAPDEPDEPDTDGDAASPTAPTSEPGDTGPTSANAFVPVNPDYPTRTPEDMEAATGGPPTRTPEQTAAIRSYSVSGYRDMNTCLRTGSACTPDVQARNAELESAMTTTTEPATVFRAMTLANLGGGISPADLSNLVGSEISDAGFTSTSLDPEQTAIFGEEQDSVNVQIEMPSGTRALFPGTDAAIREEQEVILPPGTRYRVIETSNPPPPERPSIRIQVIP